METKPPLRSDLLQPVQLRLDGLFERLQHLERTLAEVPDGLSADIRRRLERDALFRGLNAIQRSYEATATVLCLALDGSVPDAEESWYGDALDQLSGSGSGRGPVVPPALADLLRVVGVYPDFDLVFELEPNLAVQRRRHAAAVQAAPMLVGALTTLDARLAQGTLRDGQTPDPEFAAQHPGRVERARARERALHRALSGIEAAFWDRGHTTVVPFGSLVEGRVHGRSDLDLIVLGEVSREEQGALWSIAEDITRAQGVEFDLHFPAVYDPGFLDRLKVIRGGQIAPLRDLIAAAADSKTHED